LKRTNFLNLDQINIGQSPEITQEAT